MDGVVNGTVVPGPTRIGPMREEDLSNESPDVPLPERVIAGEEPFIILGAIVRDCGGSLAALGHSSRSPGDSQRVTLTLSLNATARTRHPIRCRSGR